MNAGLPPDHPSIRFYDSDYPGVATTRIAENLDEVLTFQGLAHDVSRYLELARETGGPILELCCGTGRVAIPLARAGFPTVGIDLSEPLLGRFRLRLADEPEDVRARIELVQQDVTNLSLSRQFPLIIVAFNSLLCIAEIEAQMQAIARAAAHLAVGGRLAIDVINPLQLPIGGDDVPKPFLMRISETTMRPYTRFAALGPFEASQRQRLYGWYDEITADGTVVRTPYKMHWRPIFRYELELMLRMNGLEVEKVEGGHAHEPFGAGSPRMLFIARKPAH